MDLIRQEPPVLREEEPALAEGNLSGNWVNIVNGGSAPASPDEEIIRSRGRRKSAGPVVPSEKQRRNDIIVALATRKSPRKPAKRVDFSAYFFRSPTPKKVKQEPVHQTQQQSAPKEPSPAEIRAKKSFKKRLSLSSDQHSTPSSPSSSSCSSNSIS